MIRMALSDIWTLGRNTQGVRIISLKGDDSVVGMARLEANEEEIDEAVEAAIDESEKTEASNETEGTGPDDTTPSEA